MAGSPDIHIMKAEHFKRLVMTMIGFSSFVHVSFFYLLCSGVKGYIVVSQVNLTQSMLQCIQIQHLRLFWMEWGRIEVFVLLIVPYIVFFWHNKNFLLQILLT